MVNFAFVMYRGNTFSFDIAIARDGSPVDLTGCSLKFSARLNYLDCGPVFTKTSDPGGGINILDLLGGRARVTIQPEDTQDLANIVEPLVADLRLTDTTDEVFTIASGTIEVRPVAVPIT